MDDLIEKNVNLKIEVQPTILAETPSDSSKRFYIEKENTDTDYQINQIQNDFDRESSIPNIINMQEFVEDKNNSKSYEQICINFKNSDGTEPIAV